MSGDYDEDMVREQVEEHFGPRRLPRPPNGRISVPLNKLRAIIEEDLTCPVCLDRIDSTSTVSTCLHRFCTECLERTLRLNLGPKEHHDCPQ
eukprot:gene44640-54589_t